MPNHNSAPLPLSTLLLCAVTIGAPLVTAALVGCDETEDSESVSLRNFSEAWALASWDGATITNAVYQQAVNLCGPLQWTLTVSARDVENAGGKLVFGMGGSAWATTAQWECYRETWIKLGAVPLPQP